jgi:hypothetical protein
MKYKQEKLVRLNACYDCGRATCIANQPIAKEGGDNVVMPCKTGYKNRVIKIDNHEHYLGYAYRAFPY